MGTAWARHGHGMGTAWARHGHGMGTAWAQHGHGMGMAWAWQVTDAAMLLESDGAGGLVLSSLPLSTTESGPHAARSRPSARCNHTATILGDSLYVYGGAAGSWEFDDVCRVELRMPPRAPTPANRPQAGLLLTRESPASDRCTARCTARAPVGAARGAAAPCEQPAATQAAPRRDGAWGP